jgi:flagellar motor switch protein FliM
MKPLTIQAIRAASVNASDVLAPLPPGFTALAKELGKGFNRLAASAPVFSFESCGKLAEQALAGDDAHAAMMLAADNRFALRIVMDRGFVFGLCDLVFGGVGNEPHFAEDRPLSNIERAMADMFAGLVAETLPQAFEGVEMPNFAILAAESEDAPEYRPEATVTILAAIHGATGEIKFELPRAFIAMLGPQAAQPIAAVVVQPRIDNVAVELTALLAEMPMSLGDVTRLARGQLIRLNATTATPVTVMSEGVELFRAKLGQSARRYCLGVM